MAYLAKGQNGTQRRAHIGVISSVGAVIALLVIVEGLILHAHQCPPGWTAFDFDAPVRMHR